MIRQVASVSVKMVLRGSAVISARPTRLRILALMVPARVVSATRSAQSVPLLLDGLW